MRPASPKKKLPETIALDDVGRAVTGELASMTLAELLGTTLSALAAAERSSFLAANDNDKGNGSYERGLMIGSIPTSVDVARTRSGQFRPSFLPPLYQRGYPEQMQRLLLGLLTGSRSVNAAKAALKKMGLSHSERDLDVISADFIEELELRNTRPLDPDMLALFIDGKYVEVKEGDRLRPACIYVVVGLGRDGKKRVLACVTHPGRENLEDWKKVLRSLVERGLRRVLHIAQDDFPGLLGVVRGLFARSDSQLCIVHMLRNARSHLAKSDAAEFVQRIRTIKASWDPDLAAKQFDDLCNHFSAAYPSFIAEISKKRDHYLSFLKYPEAIRRTFSTTNAVEAVNGQLERLRRNSGGYFQSDDTLKLKLGLSITFLEEGNWASPAAGVRSCLHQLNAMFQKRFEEDSE